jgi:RNA polymerase sigma factor (sigma-70 family)
MTNGQLDGVWQHIRKLAAEGAGCASDRELLERFVRDRDEASFAALVERHGPMVFGVCRRVLRHQHDAEDACQAAFLVLARRAASIRNREALGAWLHGVAYRAAASLGRRLARRRAREGPETDVPQPEAGDVTWREVRGIFDEELRRLPDRFRAPLLLCCLEGKTRDEAAQELGWSVGTLRGRLERGREMLRARLTRRGVTLSAALLAALLSERAASAALPAALAERILRAAVNLAVATIPAPVAGVLEEVSRAMSLTRLKIIAGVSLVVSLAGLGAGLLASGVLAARQPEPPRAAGAGAAQVGEPPAAPEEPPADAGRATPPGDAPGAERDAAGSRENLQKFAVAMHNYADTQGGIMPAPAIYTAQGSVPGGGPAGGSAMRSAAGPGGASVPGGGGRAAGPAGGGGPTPPGGGSSGAATTAGPTAPMGEAAGGPAAGGVGVGPQAKPGKAVLSWRVSLLPYLGEDNLYRQFHLDEPWDGPHNKALLSKMPKVYAAPGVRTREPYTTFYQVFVGPHAAFEKHRAMRMPADFTDGTSNILLIVEAANPVPWTKPEDLHFDLDEPLPELGGAYPGIFNAALADGSAHAFSAKANPDILRAAITRDWGEVADLRRIEVPTSRREAELQRRNDRLKQELEREKTRLRELRKERGALEGADDNPRVEELRKDNARLEQLLRESREEAERLRQEIERLKRPGKGGGG